jgi:hypothetical protein
MVQIHPDPPTDFPRYRLAGGHSSAGRAPALQAGGHRFDPGWLHQFSEISAKHILFLTMRLAVIL